MFQLFVTVAFTSARKAVLSRGYAAEFRIDEGQ
jgi:hypothetical protein